MKLSNQRYLCLYQYGLLFVLILLGASMGLWQEILGPTLPSLCSKLNVSYESMGYMSSFRSVGNIGALFLAAIVYDSFPFLVHYLMSAECIIAGLVTVMIPWSKYYWIVILFFLIQSGAQNALNNGGQLTILQTFKETSIAKMQLYHLGYSIGGVMSGLISLPFLSKPSAGKIRLTKYCLKSQTLIPFSNYSMKSNLKTSGKGFEYIFLIAGVFAVCSALIFLAYKCIRNPDTSVKVIQKKDSWLHKINPRYTTDGKVLYGSLMTVLLFLYYFFYIFGLLTFIPFIVVYAVDPCKPYAMSLNDATYLHTALNACFMSGRIIGSFVIGRFPIVSILTINTLNIFFNLILVFFSHRYSLALWIGACGMRLCNSIVYPSGTSFVDRYIIVSSSLISLAFIGHALGGIAGSSLGGLIVDNYPSHYITYTCFFGMFMLYATTICMAILGSSNGVRDFSKQIVISQNRKESELQ